MAHKANGLRPSSLAAIDVHEDAGIDIDENKVTKVETAIVADNIKSNLSRHQLEEGTAGAEEYATAYLAQYPEAFAHEQEVRDEASAWALHSDVPTYASLH